MQLAVHTIVLLVAAAFLAGWVDAVVGGGGLTQLPALLIGLPADTPVATVAGTNKFSSVCGTATAAATYVRGVSVDWRSALPLMVAAWVGSSGGARLVQLLPKAWFTPLVLVALVVVGTHTLRRPQLGLVHAPRHTGRAQLVRLVVIGLVIGVYDGFLGPGTGSFFVISLVAVLGYGFLQGSVLAKLANLATNLGALTVLAVSGHVLWGLGLGMAVANIAGGFTGARLAIKHGNAFVRKVFLVVIALLGAKLAWDTLAMLR